jgi:PAS domain S-box-containing protein
MSPATLRLLAGIFLATIGLISSTFASTALEVEFDAKSTPSSVQPLKKKYRQFMGPYFLVYQDSGKNLTIEDMLILAEKGAIDEIPPPSLQFGYSRNAIWLHARVNNMQLSEIESYLEIRYSPLDNIDVYLIAADNSIASHARLGDHIPYSERVIDSRIHIAPLFFAANQTYQLFVRVESVSSLAIPTYLSSPDAMYEGEHYQQIAMGMFFGLAIGLFFYNLFLLIIIRDIVYLYYIIYVFGYTAFMASLDGLLFQFWPESTAWENRSLYIFPWVCGIFLCLFCRNVLQTKSQSPMSDSLFVSFATVYVIGTVAFFFIDLGIMARLTSPVIAVNAFIILGITILRFYQGFKAASYFIIGMGSFCFGIISVATGAMNLHSNYELTPFIFKVGAAIEMIMFSIALAQRINTLQTRNKEARIEQLKRMDKIKDEFLANTSHELRTPLNAIIGIADAMSERAKDRLDHEDKRNLNLISESGYRLANLVNDILDFSKLAQDEILLTKKALDIESIIDTVIQLSQQALNDKKLLLIKHIAPSLPAVLADEDRVFQILHNLIANAIKFTPEGKITIRVLQKNAHINVVIEDTGIGIAASKFLKIFRSFEQADGSIDRKFGGTGLGLAITKKLVELHGGAIWVESELGKNAKFTFTLPNIITDIKRADISASPSSRITAQLSKKLYNIVKPSSTLNNALNIQLHAQTHNAIHQIKSDSHNQTATASTLNQIQKKKFHVLVIDDEQINLEVIQAQLSGKRYHLNFAYSGSEALQILTVKSFDLILLDVMMPEMSGYEVCEKIRENHSAEELPIIMVTAKNQVGDLVLGFQSGANDYLTKPFVREELLARIDLHLTLKDAVGALIESERKFRSIYDQALEGIFQITPTGRISGNPAMANILGYDSPDDLHNSVIQTAKQLFVDPKHREALLSDLDSKGALRQVEAQLRRKDGTLIWGYAKINRILDSNGTLLRWEGLLDDITDRKEAELALLSAYEDIESKVKTRTLALQSANLQLTHAQQEAVRTAEEKSILLANMSHEIRTPMNGILAAADLASETVHDPQLDKFLSIIKNSGITLLELVNEVLDYSKISSNRLEIEQTPFVLSELFEKLGHMFSVNMTKQKLPVELLCYLDPHIPTTLKGDVLRIQQVLTNLLSNALKFTLKGHVLLSVELRDKSDNSCQLEFKVSDTGIGIEKSYLDQIFEPFTQAEPSTSRKFGGTGLGMTISKRLVELMGGKISAESIPAQGSCFSFYLTFETATHQHAEAQIKLPLPASLHNKSVLIVDNDLEMQKILTTYISKLELKTEIAINLKESLLKLNPDNTNAIGPDFIFINKAPNEGIDIYLNTISVLRHQYQLNVPIILLINIDERRNATLLAELDICYFLEKPFSLMDIYKAIMDVSGHRSLLLNTNKDEHLTIQSQMTWFSTRKLLLAEDDPTNQFITKEILSKVGIEIDTVANGKQAISAVYDRPYDAILMDINMPEINGYEATKQIRNDIQFAPIPIIGMSAHTQPEDKEKALKAGMNGYITKPIIASQLLQTLSRHLKDIPKNTSVPVSLKNQDSEGLPSCEDLPPIQGINFESAMTKLGLDNRAYKQVLSTFYRTHKQTPKTIMDLFTKQNWQGLNDLAHRIKGSAGNIGARTIETEAFKLERACTLATQDSISQPPSVDKIVEEFTHILGSLESILREVQIDALKINNLKTDTDPEKLKQLSVALNRALESGDPSTVKKYFNELIDELGSRPTKKLKDSIDSFDYAHAIVLLKQIIERL